jgi:hypothetical protein
MRGRTLGTFVSASVIAALLLVGVPSESCGEGDAAKKADESASGAPKPIPTEQVKAKAGSRFGVVEAGPFEESTLVRGKVDADLSGVWLLVANLEVAPGKFRNFPQLLKVTSGDKGPQFHLLDVKWPEDIDKSVKEAKASKWQPTPEMRKSLAAQWSTLPIAKEKTINDFMYDRVKYELTAPDHYSEFGAKDEKLDKTLGDSKFGLRITEDYRPRELPKDVPVTQLAQRVTIYGVKTVDKNTLQGEQLTGFVAVGIATPLPFTFNGPFVMYRLASL